MENGFSGSSNTRSVLMHGTRDVTTNFTANNFFNQNPKDLNFFLSSGGR